MVKTRILRITDLLQRPDDRPVGITGSNHPPFELPVGLPEEVERIFGDQEPIQLSNNRLPSRPPESVDGSEESFGDSEQSSKSYKRIPPSDLLPPLEDRPVGITGRNYLPFELPVGLRQEVERIFEDPGQSNLDFDRGKRK